MHFIDSKACQKVVKEGHGTVSLLNRRSPWAQCGRWPGRGWQDGKQSGGG